MDEQIPPKRGTTAESMRTLGALGSVGLSFVLAIVIGAGFGYWLDTKFGTKPWLSAIFFVLGFAAGVLNVYRTAGRFIK